MNGLSADLRGKVIVVAGASSGMGWAIARAAAASGAAVIAAARRTAALNDLAAAVRATGGAIITVPTDATDRAACGQLVTVALTTHGRVDALINAVGTNIPRRTLDELTPDSWTEMIATNLTAAFNLTQAVMPALREQGDGLLVHIASAAARKPDKSGVAYQASKAGVSSLAHGAMEEERERGVRVTVIYPGLTDTPLVLKRPTPTPPEVLARALQPEDVAAACLFVLALPPRAHVPELVLYPSRA